MNSSNIMVVGTKCIFSVMSMAINILIMFTLSHLILGDTDPEILQHDDKILSNKNAGFIYLDFAKAFDKVYHKLLVQ